VAKEFGGGGHKNASGCGVRGTFEQWKPVFEQKVTAAIEAAAPFNTKPRRDRKIARRTPEQTISFVSSRSLRAFVVQDRELLD
jgi:hypothetical protein